jgi:outer membrane protein OmpA-like peptidoglycan-associated protein
MPPAQAMRSPAYDAPVQRRADPSYAGAALGGLQNRGAVVVQRSFAGSFPVSTGIFEMNMITKQDAGTGAGTNRSGMDGSITFVPDKKAPYSNKIGLIQIVKLTDAGGANVDPASMPASYGADLRTKEDKKAGVEGGFFTDVLHHDFGPANKDAPRGSDKPAYYEGGAPVFGFKRSDDAADIKSAQLQDFPSTSSKTSNLDFSFETVAKGDDTMQVFGAVKWAFGVRAGKVVNEAMTVQDNASATFEAAMEKHRNVYVHEPVTFYFGFDRPELEPGEEGKIDTFLDYLRRFPDVRLTLTGFADIKGGSGRYNEQLAGRRAQTVYLALIAKGVSDTRINTLLARTGGATDEFTTDAVTPQSKEANRRGNRRVMLTFEHTASTTGGTP